MKAIHVECKPDEALVKKLGFAVRMITHHQGKSRIFNNLKSVSNQLAMVDEDPGSPKSFYEKSLVKEDQRYGLTLLKDKSGNKVLQLSVRLEDWVLMQCKASGIKPTDFGLPDNSNHLHDVINQRISKFENLIDQLLERNNPGLKYLKEELR
ncbi:MAG: hypothetical protein JSS79_03035 [Bacteroidetes bacterium]|nr:hypothetical protein [Bacteroidota bacterium]